MITWAFAYMHVNGPEPISGMFLLTAVVVDLFIVAIITGAAIQCKKLNK